MSDVTLKAIENLLDVKLDEKFDIKLTPVANTLNQHTLALDGLAKSMQILLDNKSVTTHRIERVEKAIKELSSKVGLKLDW